MLRFGQGGFLLCASLVLASTYACSSGSGDDTATDDGDAGTDAARPDVPGDAVDASASDAANVPSPDGATSAVPNDHVDYLAALPKRDAQLKILCARNGKDLVSKRFCTATPPTLGRLTDVQSLLGLAFADTSDKGANAKGGNPGFALLGHSSSLVAKYVSAINPRAIVFSQAAAPAKDYMILGYTRGEQFVELAVHEPDENQPVSTCSSSSKPATTGRVDATGDLYGRPSRRTGRRGHSTKRTICSTRPSIASTATSPRARQAVHPPDAGARHAVDPLLPQFHRGRAGVARRLPRGPRHRRGVRSHPCVDDRQE
ncbi:MAG: hypothetical protein U0169_23085 [Polyangiaceae bacterium]